MLLGRMGLRVVRRRRTGASGVATGWVALTLGLGVPCGCGGDGEGASDAADDEDGAAPSSGGGTATSTTSQTAAPTTGGADGMESGTDDDASGTESEDAWVVAHSVGEDVGRFLSVWGTSVETLYVVGGQRDPDAGINTGALLRYNGSTWSDAPLPDDVPTINWVYGVQDRRVLVGDQGTVLWRDGDEGEWTAGSCATVVPLWGVWGAAPDDLWVVGGDGFNKDAVLCHFDGVAWAQTPLPKASLETHALFKVWGTSADNVFAVGDNGWIVHYDGEQWEEQASGTPADLISLWGTGPDEILAVGGRATATLARWDGTAWTSETVNDVPGLNGIWMDPQGDAVVAGTFGVMGRVAAGSMDLTLDDSGVLLALHAVFGLTDVVDEGPLFAVGGSLDMPPPYVGTILSWPN